ncbi:DUF3906 family protein [Ectobacillus sp. JY-23]|uniref:DUF3906 family protein n=1 Tax=Ectobacillus sp. JY-23 TaxID=2933872 RepID=UPI001FF207B1|nr:DUF3906 family protein [Ectobacillus sp. JY-23]UOY93237.1 DUF3906 family protein [Ectobacillus sp. JY-23]
MELYRFEVVAEEKVIPVIIVAENEEKAFRAVEVELEKYFLRLPVITDITLYEKKRIHKSAGYVIYEQENISI